MIPLQISFREFTALPRVCDLIKERTHRLEHYYDRIEFCKVVVSSPHHPNRRNSFHHVHIHLRIPGNDLVIDREPERCPEHRDLSLAIRDAFDSAERMLEERVLSIRDRLRRGKYRLPAGQAYGLDQEMIQ